MNPSDPTIFQLVRNWAELLYFFSGIGLLIIAGFGLYQIRIARQQLESTKSIFRKQCTRSAYESAAKECNRFSETYFPLFTELSMHIKSRKIKFFENAEIMEFEEGFKIDYEKVNEEDIEALLEKGALISNMINSLEGFALYIVSGVADDNIAFHTLGKVYVAEAEFAAKILPFTGGTQDDCKAIWTLYFRWKNRLDHHKLLTEKEEIETRLKKAKIEKFTAIGTDET